MEGGVYAEKIYGEELEFVMCMCTRSSCRVSVGPLSGWASRDRRWDWDGWCLGGSGLDGRGLDGAGVDQPADIEVT
jgi:hypothetical protein